MHPTEIGRSYDTLASDWQKTHRESSYGLAQFQRALTFAKASGHALDIGCGSSRRIIDLLIQRGFQVEGIDVSEKMIELIRKLYPSLPFHHADISTWTLPRPYDFISAWDSIWHLPLAAHEPVLTKICEGLAPGGVFLFSMVGFDEPGDHGDSGHMGVPLAYGTLGIPRTLELLHQCGCACRHLEFDQYPEKHLYIIAQKRGTTVG